MEIFFANIPISLKYPTFDQNTGLFVRASIYDVTSGSPSLVTTANMANISNGYYFGNFNGSAGKTYLGIALSYTDGTYSTIDTGRAPASQIYKEATAPQTFCAWEYALYDFETNLNVAGLIYDCTSGSASFINKVAMAHVLGGVYFGSLTVTASKVFQIEKLVYTDNTFGTINTEYTMGSEDFTSFLPTGGGGGTTVTNVIMNASLVGQVLKGKLVGQSLKGVLVKT